MRHQYGTEIWRPAPNFALYDISTYGRVRNRRTGRIKAQREYGDVFLRKCGKSFRVNPTKLALQAFRADVYRF